MPPNETTVLLTNYREKRSINPSRSNYGAQHEENYDKEKSHIVNVGKDPTDYEPILSIEDFSSALTLAELLPYQDDPWWQRFRFVSFMSFWLILVMTFITACTISYLKFDPVACRAVIGQDLISAISTTATPSELSTTLVEVLATSLLNGNSKLSTAILP